MTLKLCASSLQLTKHWANTKSVWKRQQVFTKFTAKKIEMEFNIQFNPKIKLILSKDGHLHFC